MPDKSTNPALTTSITERIGILECVISLGQEWMKSIQPKSAEELIGANAAKQLAEETLQFATLIRAAAEHGYVTPAYANLRLLLDRLLHAAQFFVELEDVTAWMWWSTAEISKLANDAMSQGAVNKENHEEMREMLGDIRHWNRTEDGKDRQMLKPSKYPWQQRKDMAAIAEPRPQNIYKIASTYVHPTYRGQGPKPEGLNHALTQAIWITSCTLIVCEATLNMYEEEEERANQIDQNILLLVEILATFLKDNLNLAAKIEDPPNGASKHQMFHLYTLITTEFILGKESTISIKNLQ